MSPQDRRPALARSAAAFLAVLAFGVACDTASVVAPADRVEGTAESAFGSGLRQTVTVRPAVLLDGNDIEIRSVIVNVTSRVITITLAICSLDVGGTLLLTEIPTIAHCAAYSGQSTLFPGDSVVMSDLQRFTVSRGAYVLRVRHALQPEHWISVPVARAVAGIARTTLHSQRTISLGRTVHHRSFAVLVSLSPVPRAAAPSTPPRRAMPPPHRTPGYTSGVVTAETVASGLEHPWALAFLPDGRLLVTERPGRLRLVEMSGHGERSARRRSGGLRAGTGWTARRRDRPGVRHQPSRLSVVRRAGERRRRHRGGARDTRRRRPRGT